MSDKNELSNEEVKTEALKQYNKKQSKLPVEEREHNFPTEIVELASKGLLYPEGHPLSSGEIEMKYMTAADEDILATPSYIKKGIVFDKLFEALIVTPVDFNDILLSDKDSIMIAARILSGYGKTYDVSLPGKKEKYSVDLTQLKDSPLHKAFEAASENSFVFILPTTDEEITFHLMTQRDKLELQQKLQLMEVHNKKRPGSTSHELTTRLKQMIDSVNGNTDPLYIGKFVDSMLAGDSRKFRDYVTEISPGLDTEVVYENDDGELQSTNFPLGVDFLYPGV